MSAPACALAKAGAQFSGRDWTPAFAGELEGRE